MESGEFQTTSCDPNVCTSSQVANSDMSNPGSIQGVVGDSVAVTCETGFSGSGTVTCTIDEEFTSLTCSPNACSDATFDNSNRDSSNPLVGVTNDVIQVVCNHGYKGGGTSTCQNTGMYCVSLMHTNTYSTQTNGLLRKYRYMVRPWSL